MLVVAWPSSSRVAVGLATPTSRPPAHSATPSRTSSPRRSSAWLLRMRSACSWTRRATRPRPSALASRRCTSITSTWRSSRPSSSGRLGRCGCAITSQESDTRQLSDASLRGDRASASLQSNLLPLTSTTCHASRSKDKAATRTTRAPHSSSSPLRFDQTEWPQDQHLSASLPFNALLRQHYFGRTASSPGLTAHESHTSKHATGPSKDSSTMIID
jgi:hypothetical protein